MLAGNAIVTILFGLLATNINAQPGNSCTTPNNERARCVAVQNCRVLYDKVTSRDRQVINFLQASQCGYEEGTFYVCCGAYANYRLPDRNLGSTGGGYGATNLLPNRDSCGFQDTDRILGGTATDYAEFPWMALLQYRKHSGGLTFSCGGALISNRYVLTAAHCITGQITQKVGTLVSVRLGEWSTDTDQDCSTIGKFRDCNDPAVDVPVQRAIAHADYDDGSRNRYNDIGIIRLNREVRFSQFIKPICLPTTSERAPNGAQLWVSGWGRTEYANASPVKLKVGVPVVGKQQCFDTFKSAGVDIADTQLCAGGAKNKDSCNGDSGGPLMYETTKEPKQWIVEGVVSFGTRCGTQNWPGVYTRVSEYIGWIEERLEP